MAVTLNELLDPASTVRFVGCWVMTGIEANSLRDETAKANNNKAGRFIKIMLPRILNNWVLYSIYVWRREKARNIR